VFDGHFRTSICGAKQRPVISSHSYWAIAPSHYKLSETQEAITLALRTDPFTVRHPPHHLVMPVPLENNAKQTDKKPY